MRTVPHLENAMEATARLAREPVVTPPTAPLTVRTLDAAEAVRWDAFVDQCPEATFFHRAGWCRVLEDVLGHRTRYLYAESGGVLEGVLPLGHVKSRLFGNALISTPFCVYGGVAATTERARGALTDAACRLAEDLGVDYLELRNLEPRNPAWPRKDLYVTFRKPIDPDPEKNLLEIPRKQRAMVRKGIQAGLVSQVDAGVDRLYAAYSESVRNLGTPVLPRRYYAALLEVFGKACDVLTITKDGELVASVLSFYFRDQVLPYYGGGTEAARELKGNDFMYWELMRRSCERGYRLFDYGRSKVGTGSYSFKKNWGFEPEPLAYEYHLVRAREVPDVNPLNPKYRMFINLWQKLPLGLSQALGPVLARNLG
jgi:FemAB-related protein (PEP-CTERM system-associated)